MKPKRQRLPFIWRARCRPRDAICKRSPMSWIKRARAFITWPSLFAIGISGPLPQRLLWSLSSRESLRLLSISIRIGGQSFEGERRGKENDRTFFFFSFLFIFISFHFHFHFHFH